MGTERFVRLWACLAIAWVSSASLQMANAATMPTTIRLTSPVIAAEGRIPLAQSNYGANRSPPLTWTAVAGARSYVVILDDPDAPGPRPFVHWLIWNIPGAATSLPGGLPGAGRLADPPGAVQGRNDADEIGYFGPRPPSGVHHYRFRILALDTLLAAPPGSDRGTLSGAMSGHVLAAGGFSATYPAPGER